MIRAIVFDFDGTMSDRRENAYRDYEAHFREILPPMAETEMEAMLQDMMICDCNGTIPYEMRLAPFYNKYQDILPADFKQSTAAFFYEHMPDYCVLAADTLEILNELKPKYKLGLLSNGGSIPQHRKISKVGIEDYFDVILVSGDLQVHKPDKRIFMAMADKLGLKCEECLMVGDVFSTDILGACRSGMIPVWITPQQTPAHHYRGYRISRLGELKNIIAEVNGQ